MDSLANWLISVIVAIGVPLAVVWIIETLSNRR